MRAFLFARARDRALRLSLVLLIGSTACAHAPQPATVLPTTALLASNDLPALFLTAQPGAAQIGYVSDDVALVVTGAPTLGRVPVRIEGALAAHGYVAADQLSLRVQKRGRIRGTPVYVGPDDRVRVLGADADTTRLRVEVTPRLGERALGRFEGSFPGSGLGVAHAAGNNPAPEPGVRYRVPAQTPVALFELPARGPVPPGPQVAELSAQPEPYEVTVVRALDGWLAVRAGSGPYLIGWTQASLVPLAGASAPPSASAASTHGASPTQLPTRLANEQGELRRVVAGAQVTFGNQVIGVFQAAGWARVQRMYGSEFADVFAAVDDAVALRGVVRSADLQAVPVSTPEPVSEKSTPAEARSPAP